MPTHEGPDTISPVLSGSLLGSWTVDFASKTTPDKGTSNQVGANRRAVSAAELLADSRKVVLGWDCRLVHFAGNGFLSSLAHDIMLRDSKDFFFNGELGVLFEKIENCFLRVLEYTGGSALGGRGSHGKAGQNRENY